MLNDLLVTAAELARLATVAASPAAVRVAIAIVARRATIGRSRRLAIGRHACTDDLVLK